ncbi:molybdenum cofactor guanylyltransferase [Aliifodinibius sp. S!AR15-10]|uniref:molybdenum cofactor guanylyltransferase n=1 Tax=Aliifodinibius sp. S!AR15-10 TaxID=2950437 RepID=UPI00286355AB|nr:molybdenum cofactor guanylyltransferase [Aliifodinibius sp. S!AR15-10]MDR8390722.1 molybdenum cofactor guanylyltransferase [Aliifodinibius sp. S!AR15-10]
MPNSIKNITGFVMAGGGSRRFGSKVDKALVPFRGKPLILHPAETLADFFAEVTIIAKNRPAYENLGFPVIEDAHEAQNPLVGIYTGLKFSSTPWNFFAACDMPFLSDKVIEKLMKTVVENDGGQAKIIVPKTGACLQPMAALYHRSLIDIIEEKQDEIDSLKALINHVPALEINFESDRAFINVNTREQLRNLH